MIRSISETDTKAGDLRVSLCRSTVLLFVAN